MALLGMKGRVSNWAARPREIAILKAPHKTNNRSSNCSAALKSHLNVNLGKTFQEALREPLIIFVQPPQLSIQCSRKFISAHPC
jgi:hypothetical protein